MKVLFKKQFVTKKNETFFENSYIACQGFDKEKSRFFLLSPLKIKLFDI